MSVRVMTDVWRYSQASATDLLVLLALADIADDDGECWPSIAHLASKCRVSSRTVQRCIRALEQIGEVVVIIGAGKASTPGGTRSNRYRIVAHIPEAEGGDILTGGVTRDGGGVSPVSGGGVSPVSPEPSVRSIIEPSSLAPASPTPVARPRDELFDAVVEVCGIQPTELTPTARGGLNRAVADLRRVGADPQGIRERAAAYHRRYKSATLTPPALAKHWPQLGPDSDIASDPIGRAVALARSAGR